MRKTVSVITAIAGFYIFPNLLAADLAEKHTIGFAVYAVYIIAVLAWTYYVRSYTQDEMRQAYRLAEKAAVKATFNERMKNL